MDFLLLGLEQLARWDVALSMVAGAVIGVIVGAIPGAGAAVTIAILLPTTFAMDPLVGITLLLGVYCGSAYGCAIPAVLINTPGSPVAVLTAVEAYPMTMRGEGRRAMSIAYSSSFVGGIVAVAAMIFLTRPLAEFASRFGSAEFAMVALFALVLVVVGHVGQRVEAAAALSFGLFLATVGVDRAFNTQRFTFDHTFLMSGMPLVPVVIGLFAMSQAIVQMTDRSGPSPQHKLTGRFFDGFFEIFRYPVTLFGSSAFGVMCGILPGVGEFLAQQVSYTVAKRFARTRDQFGKGSPEGIIVSEATNNAVPPAAFIPMLALGIPGEELTAMMLAVFLVHNVIPGPQLFIDRPEFVAGLYTTLLLMNVVIIVFLMVATRWIALVATVEKRFVGAMILTLALVGTYATNYRLSDPLLALCFGFLGYVLRRHKWPVTPVLLGLVMGPIVEGRFRQALGTANGDFSVFVARPISAAMVIAIVVLIGLAIRGEWKRRKPLEEWQINAD
ncbi:MAG: tripartite tricarboxylate transporter permease [Phyllobacteriaceae bacterium]|nr:tripartite tricarboxylate transporter permease [Phyllobacteriaceae bacterium]